MLFPPILIYYICGEGNFSQKEKLPKGNPK